MFLAKPPAKSLEESPIAVLPEGLTTLGEKRDR
jgi:hypothetical protein